MDLSSVEYPETKFRVQRDREPVELDFETISPGLTKVIGATDIVDVRKGSPSRISLPRWRLRVLELLFLGSANQILDLKDSSPHTERSE